MAAPVDTVPETVVPPLVAPMKEEKNTTAGNATVVVLMAMAFASGYWLPKKFNIDHLTAGLIGFGAGVVLVILGFIVYFRFMIWRARKHVLSESERAEIMNDPAVQKFIADVTADEKTLGIDQENKANSDAIIENHGREMRDRPRFFISRQIHCFFQITFLPSILA